MKTKLTRKDLAYLLIQIDIWIEDEDKHGYAEFRNQRKKIVTKLKKMLKEKK